MQSTDRVEFLNDPQNFTGYSQVLRATHQDGTGHLTKTVVYIFGHDEISQTTQTYDATGTATETRTEFFAHDGHGSVRALLDAVGAIATVSGVRQLFTYDAWGNAVGFDMVSVATVLLYSASKTTASGRVTLKALPIRREAFTRKSNRSTVLCDSEIARKSGLENATLKLRKTDFNAPLWGG